MIEYEPISDHRTLESYKHGLIFRSTGWKLPELGYKFFIQDREVISTLDSGMEVTLYQDEPLLGIYNKDVLAGVYKFQQFDRDRNMWIPQVLEFRKYSQQVLNVNFIELGLSDNKGTFLYRVMKIKE